MSQARYRLGQFSRHLWPLAPGPEESAEVERVLGKPLAALFRRQTTGEQAHCLRVMRRVANGAGPNAPLTELLQAALLHDVGKSLAPLSLADRTLVVLAYWLAPRAASRWGQGEPRGWRRPFVTAQRHADWGAELCAEAGATPLTVRLIRRHQSPVTSTRPAAPEDEMLSLLQAADNAN